MQKSRTSKKANIDTRQLNIRNKVETLNKIYTPVKGSLENKVQGVCDQKNIKIINKSDINSDKINSENKLGIIEWWKILVEGTRVHQAIAEDIYNNVKPTGKFNFNLSINTIFETKGPIGRVRPDITIVNGDNVYIYEIKPDSTYGHNTATAQAQFYVDIINSMNMKIFAQPAGDINVDNYLETKHTVTSKSGKHMNIGEIKQVQFTIKK